MSTEATRPLSDSAKAMALSVGLGLTLVLLPPLVILVLPSMPLPVAYVTYRHGFWAGLGTGVAAGAIVTAVLGLFAGLLTSASNALTLSMFISIFMVMLIAVVGTAAGLGLRRGFTQRRMFILLLVGFFLCLGLVTAAFVLSAVMSSDGSVRELFRPGESIVRDFNSYMGATEQQISDNLQLIRYMTPAVLLIVSLFLSGASMAIARRAFNLLKQPFPKEFVFRDFRLHFIFAYVMIAGLLCELAGPYVSTSYVDLVSIVGINLITVAETLFFIQGLAIGAWFMWRYKVSRPKRIAIYGGLVLMQFVLSIVSWLGLFDTWLDYRKRFGQKAAKGQ